MKKRIFAITIFFITLFNSILIYPLKANAAATNMDEAIENVVNMTDYILKWEEEYIGYRQTFEVGHRFEYDREGFTDALADFVSDFQSTANEIEQKYYSKYLTDESEKPYYQAMWQSHFFEACRDTTFVVSVLDDYTEYITSQQTFEEGCTPLYIRDVGINEDEGDYLEVYLCTPFAYISNEKVDAGDIVRRLYYSASYYNETDSTIKSEDYNYLAYEYNLAPSNIDSFGLVEGTYNGVNPRLLALEQSIFSKWGIRHDTAAGVGNMFLNIVPIDDVTESIIQSIAGILATFSLDVLTSVSEQLLDLGPNLDLFMRYFGKDVGGNTLPDGTTLIDLNKIFLILGYVITTALFLFFLILCSVNPSGEKNSVIQLLITYPLILFAIYFSDDIVNIVYDLALSAWTSVFTGSMLETSSLPYLMAYLVTIEYLNVVWDLEYLGVLFNIAVGWIIIKNALTMFIEVIERYVVSCLLYFGFGTSLSTLISATTRPIFFAYMRMIISQLFLLFLNIYFIKGFFLLLVNYTSWAGSIYGIIFVLAYLKTAQKIDSHLHSLGLNVAQTGTGLAFSVMGIGATMLGGAFATMKLAQTAGRMGAKVGKVGTMGIGIGMEALATKKGDIGMFAKAQGFKNGSVLGGLLSSPNAQTAQNLAFASARKNPTGSAAFKAAMSDGKVGSAVNSALGGKATSSLNANLGSVAKANLGKITGGQFGGAGASFSSQGTSIGGKTHNISGTLSQSAANGGRYVGTATDGTAMFAKINSKPSAQVGDSFAINLHKDQNGFAMTSAEAMTGVDLSKVPGLQERLANCEGATLHCQAGKNGNMYTITDGDNNRIGGFDSKNNYYSDDRDINLNEKSLGPDGDYAVIFDKYFCGSSELTAELSNASLAPQELLERIDVSVDDIQSKINDTKDELTDTIKEIADTKKMLSDYEHFPENYPEFDKDSTERHLHDLQAKESSLLDSIETDTNYRDSVNDLKDSLESLSETGYKDIIIGLRDGNIEVYKMENVTISDVAMGETKYAMSNNVKFIPIGSVNSDRLDM